MAQEVKETQTIRQWWRKVKWQQALRYLGWGLYVLLLVGALAAIGIRSLIGTLLFFISAGMLWGGISLLLKKRVSGRKRISGYVLGSLLGAVGLVALSFALYLMLSGSITGTLIAIPLIALGLFFLVYYVLAPDNKWSTFNQEGTGKVVMRGDKFHKGLIQWEGRTFDADWNVIAGREFHLFGGLRFVGWYPLDYIYRYWFEWTGLRPDGVTPLPHDPELLDYIMLKQDVYFGETKEAEDLERLPLDVSFVLTIRITNPYKALF